jgi:uncharacterized protein
MNSKTFPVTPKTKITRLPKRGVYDEEIIYGIIDEALFCTLAYTRDQLPFQIPTGHCRMGDSLYIHGSVGSFYMRELAEKKSMVSVSFTLMDGIVLARSAFHHSVNYPSVVVFGTPQKVIDENELYTALEVFTNKMQPGRYADVRQPNAGEWKATMVLRIDIEEASAKVRTGPPKDDEEDYQLDIWAGVVPLQLQRLPPIPDPQLKEGINLPNYIQ